MAIPGESCERHEAEIRRLYDRTNDLTLELGKRETAIVALQENLKATTARVPEHLGETIARMDEKMTGLQISVGDIVEALKRGYVTVTEFEPVKRVVYGLVGLILVTVAGALLSLVILGKVHL